MGLLVMAVSPVRKLFDVCFWISSFYCPDFKYNWSLVTSKWIARVALEALRLKET